MSLPSAVQKAADRSEALVKQLNEPAKPSKAEGTTPEPEPQPKQEDTSKPHVEKPQEEDFKQKYQTLQGKFNAQVPALQQEVKNLQYSITALQEENRQLKEKPAEPQKMQDPKSQLDPETFKEYGDEFGALIETIQSMQAENNDLKEQLNKISGDVSQAKESGEQREYNQYLGQVKAKLAELTATPFDVLNTDQKFLNFLRQYPENEIESRFAKLNRAERQRDINGTLEIFKEYLGDQQPAAEPVKKPEPKKPNIQPTPQNTGTDLAPPDPQDEIKVWSRADIKDFYAKKIKGFFRGKEDQAKAIEDSIYLATKKGKVVA